MGIYRALRTFLLLSACTLFLGSNDVLGLYSKTDAVVPLDGHNFDKLVTQSDGVAVVEFYAPWCGHCQQLAPQYKKVASNLQGLALVGAVDCNDQKANGQLCTRMKIQGFPTIKLFGSDKVKNPYTGEFNKEGVDYNGPRTAKPIVDAVTSLLNDLFIARLKDKADVGKFTSAAAGKPQVLLFTNKRESPLLYKSLSTQLRRALAFGEVHESAEGLVAEYGVEAFPTVLVVKADGSREAYKGELRAPALLKYLSDLAGVGGEASAKAGEDKASGKDASKKGGKSSKAGSPASAFVRQVSDLSELPALDAREDMALLALHGAEGPDGCKDARAAFLEAAGEMQAVVDTLLVSVPGSDLTHGSAGAQALERMGVDVAALAAEPCELQIVLLPLGKDKADLDDYQKYSGPAEGKALQRWVTDSIPAYFAARLDDSSFGHFLGTDPSRGRMAMAPKVLLFTNKDEVPGLFRALAMAMRNRGNLMFGWVQVGSLFTKRTVDTFKPTKVPSMTIIVAEPDTEESAVPGGTRLGQQPYFGPLKYAPMRTFLEDFAKAVEAASGVVDDPELLEKALPQVSSQSDFERHCTSKPGLCLLAALDSAAPGYEEERQELLKLALQASREGSAFHFAWTDGWQQRGLLQAFGLSPADVPTLVAISAKRMRFAALPAPESASGPRLAVESVRRFIDGVLDGKVRTTPLQAMPEIGGAAGNAASAAEGPAGGADAAGGAAAEAELTPVEEEFDLSDIMSEEVEGGVAAGKADRLLEIEEQLKAEEEARKAAAEDASKRKSKKKAKKAKKGKAKGSGSEEL